MLSTSTFVFIYETKASKSLSKGTILCLHRFIRASLPILCHFLSILPAKFPLDRQEKESTLMFPCLTLKDEMEYSFPVEFRRPRIFFADRVLIANLFPERTRIVREETDLRLRFRHAEKRPVAVNNPGYVPSSPSWSSNKIYHVAWRRFEWVCVP